MTTRSRALALAAILSVGIPTLEAQVSVRRPAEASPGHAGDRHLWGRVTRLAPPQSVVIDERLPLVVTADTLYDGGLTAYADLELGQLVEVIATRAEHGPVLVATEIRLREADGSADDLLRFTSRGRVVSILSGHRFALDDHRVYGVVDRTRWGGRLQSFDDLEIGHFITVMAVRTASGSLIAEFVRDGDQADYRTIRGIVASSAPARLVLVDGTSVRLVAETRYSGDCDRREDLAPGWAVEILAIPRPDGHPVALAVRGDDRAQPTVQGHDYEPFEALVITAEGVDADSVAVDLGARVAAEIADVAVLLRWPTRLDDEVLAAAADHPGVVAVEPNYFFRDPESVRRRYPIIDLSPVIEDWELQEAVSLLKLGTAHATTLGAGVVVAVIDNGLDPDHPLLADRILAGGLDLIDGDRLPWEESLGEDEDGDGDVDEAVGHGTFVASVVRLVAPEAAILPYRVLDDDGGGTAFDLALALADAIAREVDVVNLSMSYHRRSEVVDALIESAAAAGIVVVAAAGNDQSEAIPFPASDSNTIAATALTADGEGLWPPANRSSAVEVAAPGEEIYGALTDERYGTWDGTSFAAPFVSGVAALIRSLDPSLDAELVEQAIVQGGRPMVEPSWSGVALDAAGSVELLGE